MLERVRQFWVEGVLEKSLHKEILLQLGKQEQPEAVQHPWDMQLQETADHESKWIPKDKPVIEIFEEMGRSLLILGAPGSGKTITLLDLARDAIARAKEDFSLPIPVVFNLSSWAERKPTLAVWLVEELNLKYKIPRKVSKQWLENDDLLLLFDGFDEVKKESRPDCVNAINAFHQEHGLTDIVVCSRLEEYQSLSTQLKLQGALLIQPLTIEQIDAYLANFNDELATLCSTIKEDTTLQELAVSPLILSIMVAAYRGVAVEVLQTPETINERRKRLFDLYIVRMLKRRDAHKRYTPQQTIRWLAWTACKMIQHGQTEFFIEDLQPTWLKPWKQRWFYNLSVELLVDFVFISLLIFSSGLLFKLLAIFSNKTLNMFNVIIINGFIIGLPCFLFFLLSFRMVTFVARKLSEGLTIGIAVGLTTVFSIIISLFTGMLGFFIFLIGGPVLGLSAGLIGISVAKKDKIQISDTISWSWENAKRGILIGLIFIGPIIGLSFGVVLGVVIPHFDFEHNIQHGMNDWGSLVFIGFIIALLSSPLFGMIFMLISGLTRSIVIEMRITPNQGIYLSASNAIQIGSIFMLWVSFITISFVSLLQDSQAISIFWGIILGLPIGLSTGLFWGGTPCIQHFILRFILAFKEYLPWNLVHFLDYATDRILLRKAGGGYIFIHRLLLEHFATLWDDNDTDFT